MRLAVVVGVVVCGLQSVAAQTPPTPGSVEGSVEEHASGRPVAVLEVNLRGAGKTRQTKTDTSGRFAFADLPPAEYLIFIDRESGYVPAGRRVTVQPGQKLSGTNFKVERFALLTGKVTDSGKNPVARAKVSVRADGYRAGRRTLIAYQSTYTDDQGAFRLANLMPGSYLLEAEPPQLSVRSSRQPPAEQADESTPVMANVRTYYPGVPSVEDASLLTLRPGAQLTDLTLLKMPTTCVSSQVADLASGGASPVPVTVSEKYPKSQSKLAVGNAVSGDYIEVCGLNPGTYRLSSYAIERNGALRYASEDVTVAKRPVAAPPLVLTPAQPLQGRVVLHEPKSDEALPNGLHLRIEPKDRLYMGDESADSEVRPDGRFTFPNVLRDEYWLTIDRLPNGYYVRRASNGEREAYARPFSPAGGELEVVLGSDGPVVTGQVQDDEGHPAAGATVIIAAWPLPEAPAPNQIVAVRAGDDGLFAVGNIAPGNYRAVALTHMPEARVGDPVFLRGSFAQAIETTLSPREQKFLRLVAESAPVQ